MCRTVCPGEKNTCINNQVTNISWKLLLGNQYVYVSV